MPLKVNPVTGELDLVMAPGHGIATVEFATDTGTANPTGAGVITVSGGVSISTTGVGDVVTINLEVPLDVSSGGTGLTTITDGSILVGDGTNSIEMVGPLTDGQILIGDTAGVSPVAATITAGGGIDITNGAGSITIAIDDPLSVAYGGTGAATLTDGGILLGSGTSAITATAAPTDGQLLIGSTGVDPVIATLTAADGVDIVNAAGSITIGSPANSVGFIDPANDVTTSFVNGTSTYTIQPTAASFTYWSDGGSYTKSAPESIIVGTDEGAHYLYYNGATLSQTTTWTDDLITKYAFVAIIYWDATNNEQLYIGDEFLHTTSMSPLTHVYLHDTRGFALDTGGGLTDISSDGDGDLLASAEFGVEATVAWDEDAKFSHTARTSISNIAVYYKTGADASNIWRYDDTASYGVLNTGTGRAAYNQLNAGTWQQTEVGNNNYVLAHVFTFNDSTRKFGVIQGENSYATIPLARDGAETEILAITLDGLPGPEIKFLGTLIYQTADAYNVVTNPSKSRIRTTGTGDDYVDLRDFGVTRGGVSGTLTDHGALTGLSDDDHTQYLLADGTRALAGAWDMGGQATTNVNIDSGVITGITDLLVADGGTGVSTLADHGILLGSDAAAITATAAPTNGQLLIGSTGVDPVLGTLTDGSGITITEGAGTITVAMTDPVTVAIGGTGAQTLTDGGILLGSGTGAITATAQPTNGQLLIGSTGVDPVLGTLTDGSGITISEGAGTITVAMTDPVTVAIGGTGVQTLTAYAVICGGTTATGAVQSIASVGTAGQVLMSNGAAALPTFQTVPGDLSWSVITDATKTIVVNEAYIGNHAAGIDFSLPATAAVGSIFKITGIGAGLTTISQAANQYINVVGSTTTVGAGGSLVATEQFDSIEIVCVVADNGFNVLSMTGNWTIT